LWGEGGNGVGGNFGKTKVPTGAPYGRATDRVRASPNVAFNSGVHSPGPDGAGILNFVPQKKLLGFKVKKKIFPDSNFPRFGDVTIGGGEVEFGPGQLDLLGNVTNRSTCPWDFVISAYVARGRRSAGSFHFKLFQETRFLFRTSWRSSRNTRFRQNFGDSSADRVQYFLVKKNKIVFLFFFL